MANDINNKLSIYQRAKNYVLPKLGMKSASTAAINPFTLPFTQRNAQLPQYYIMPLQLERMAHDISMWRQAIVHAENAMYPTRYYMQRMFVDTILEGHTLACMQKRKDLSLLKDFVIQDESGKPNDELTRIFKDRQWFMNMLNYILDAQFYGYSLIQLGDLEMQARRYNFPRLTNIRRINVEPDRQNLVSIPLQKTGVNFLDASDKDEHGQSYYDWSVYVDTPTDVGHSVCGYGLLYNAAIYCIILKNNLSNNSDYTQMFAAPYRHVKTPKGYSGDLDKSDRLFDSMSSMGSTGFVITDDDVNIEFVSSKTGTGWNAYGDLEERCEKKISKIILGHADAMDSTPGKLGGGQGSDPDASPVGKALADVEKKQDMFLLNVLNDIVLPKLRKMGFPVPEGLMFGVTRDKEEIEARRKEDDLNKITAEIAQTMKNAGLKMDAKYFEERTGIPTSEAPEPEPMASPFAGGKDPEIKKKLNKIYGFR